MASARASKTSSMNWDLEATRAAQRALRAMPVRDRERVNQALNDMKTDPLSGDITALRGEYHGLCRRRVGSWRIIFGLKPDRRLVLVGDRWRRQSSSTSKPSASVLAIPSLAFGIGGLGCCICCNPALTRRSSGSKRPEAPSQYCRSLTPTSPLPMPSKATPSAPPPARRSSAAVWRRSLFEHRPVEVRRIFRRADRPCPIRNHLFRGPAQGRNAGGVTASVDRSRAIDRIARAIFFPFISLIGIPGIGDLSTACAATSRAGRSPNEPISSRCEPRVKRGK